MYCGGRVAAATRVEGERAENSRRAAAAIRGRIVAAAKRPAKGTGSGKGGKGGKSLGGMK